MAQTTTTLAAAVLTSDTSITVTSATSFVANGFIKVDEEWMQITSAYVSGTNIPVKRAINGTAVRAHASGANVVTGVGSDFADPPATTIVAYGLSARRRRMLSYSAAGAITLPSAGEDMVAIINGTSALAMTIAAPTKDNDGALLYVVGNGAAAHTVAFTGGLSGAGTSYDVVTVNATAPIGLMAMAVNGLWVTFAAPALTGTVTAITGGLA